MAPQYNTLHPVEGRKSSSWPRLSVTALALAVCMLLLNASPAWSYKPESGAGNAVVIPIYENPDAYLADGSRSDADYVIIGGSVYDVDSLEAINDQYGLTESNLPCSATAEQLARVSGDEADSTEIGTPCVGHGALNHNADARPPGARSSVAPSHEAGESLTALGSGAQVLGSNSIALGNGALVSSSDSIALGNGAQAGLGPQFPNANRYNIALGNDAQAMNSSIALGYEAQARVDSIALGNGAQAISRDVGAIAVGDDARALGNFATTIGSEAISDIGGTAIGGESISGPYNVAIGGGAVATGDNSVVVGGGSSYGAGGTAVGSNAQAGIFSVLDEFTSVSGFIDVLNGDFPFELSFTDLQDGTDGQPGGYYYIIDDYIYSDIDLHQAAETSGGLTVNNFGEKLTPIAAKSDIDMAVAAWRIGHYLDIEDYRLNTEDFSNVADYLAHFGDGYVVVGNKFYNANDLFESVHASTPLPVPIDVPAGAVAVGLAATAPAEDAVAIGRQSLALGSDSIAIGARVKAQENEVVIGGSDHSYKLPGLAPQSGTEYLTVDSNGQLSSAGGGGIDIGTLGTAGTGSDKDGTAFQRIQQLQDDLGTKPSDKPGTAFEQIKRLQDSLGTIGESANKGGTAYQRILHVQKVIDEAEGDDVAILRLIDQNAELASDTQSLLTDENDRIDALLRSHLEDIAANAASNVIRIDSRDNDGNPTTIVALQGKTNEQIQALMALLSDGAGIGVALIGEDGMPLGTSAKEFRAMDDPNNVGGANDLEPIPIGSNNRLGYLFEALYGDPTDGVVYNPSTDSDTPHEKSAVGRINALEEGNLASAYRHAPAIGSGTSAPRASQQRRVVVQDENADGTIRLSTIGLSELTAVDSRVEELSEQQNQNMAMASALSGLPSMVPGNRDGYFGVGLGTYGGESAAAIGAAIRLNDRLLLNVGGTMTSSNNGRAGRLGLGVGFDW